MNLLVKEITETEVVFSNEERTVTIPTEQIDDFAYLSVGQVVEFGETDSVPYQISRQRRLDIREHHAEEARCGNI